MYKKFASIQNSTEVYILKSTMQYIDGLPGPSKRKLKEEGEFSSKKENNHRQLPVCVKLLFVGFFLCLVNS